MLTLLEAFGQRAEAYGQRALAALRPDTQRLQSLCAGGVFAVAGIAGAPAAALAGDPAPATTDPAAAAVVQQVAAPSLGAPSPADPAAPSVEELHPVQITGEQKRFTPDAEQLANAKAIVDAGKEMNLPPRAWTIAVATSLQESNLHNLGHLGQRNDHDSQGLFQQRPSSGWGTPEQITDPNYSAKAFYRGLVQVDGWQSMPLTKAAQKVQVSAYPNHYAKHEAQAGDIIAALYGDGPYADAAASLR
jgi:hypothetical protein